MPRSRLREDQIRDADVLTEAEHDALIHENLTTSGILNFQDGTISGTGNIHADSFYGDGSNINNINADTVGGIDSTAFSRRIIDHDSPSNQYVRIGYGDVSSNPISLTVLIEAAGGRSGSAIVNYKIYKTGPVYSTSVTILGMGHVNSGPTKPFDDDAFSIGRDSSDVYFYIKLGSYLVTSNISVQLLSLNPNADFTVSYADYASEQSHDTTVNSSGLQYQGQDVFHAGNFGKTQIDALNIDADTVDTLHASSFLRSDASDETTGTLKINLGESGQGSQHASAAFIIEDDTNSTINILTPSTSYGGILCGDEGGTGRGGLIYDHSDDSLDLLTAGTSKLTIDSSGNIAATGIITLSSNSQYPLQITGTSNDKMILSGASQPNIRLQEGTTDKANIRWSPDGYILLWNIEDESGLRIKDDLDFTPDGGSNYYSVYHENNFGKTEIDALNIDADTVDSLHASDLAQLSASNTFQGVNNYFQNYVNVGKNGGGDSIIYLYDDTNNAYRSLRWYDSESDFYVNDTVGLQKIYHSGNFGKTEIDALNIDADTVDSLHASSFLRSDADDTATGLITFSHTAGLVGRYQETNTALSFYADGSTPTFTNSEDTFTLNASRVGGGNEINLRLAAQQDIEFASDANTVRMTLKHNGDLEAGGAIKLSSNSQYPLQITGINDGKIVLSGSNQPYIRFREDTTDKANIQWDSSGFLGLTNQEDASSLRIKDDLDFTPDGGSNYYSIWHEGNDGSGSGLDADTVDTLHASSFLRSDADDTATGIITLSSNSAFPLQITGTNDQKIRLEGATNPYIKFREATIDKAYVQWHSDGYFRIRNEEDGSQIRIKDDLDFSPDGGSTNYSIWHDGDGGGATGSFVSQDSKTVTVVNGRITNIV